MSACLALIGTTGALACGASAAAAVILPPELQALEQKAQTLQLSSERFSLDFTAKAPSGEETSVTGAGVVQISPPLAELTETVDSKRIVARVVGSFVYLRYPGLARIDGGRPWVRTVESKVSEETGVNPGAAPQSISTAYALIDSATESVQEVGPATVDGQATIEFTATVDLDQLLSRFGAKLVKKLEHVGIATASLDMYIAPTGLPVRTSVSIGVEGGTIAVSTDVLATDVPVSVSAPPAGKTVSEAEFVNIERRHAKH